MHAHVSQVYSTSSARFFPSLLICNDRWRALKGQFIRTYMFYIHIMKSISTIISLLSGLKDQTLWIYHEDTKSIKTPINLKNPIYSSYHYIDWLYS